MAVSLLLLAAACTRAGDSSTSTGVDTTSTTSTTTTTVPPVLTGRGIEGETIRVGAMLPLSGILEPLGRSVAAGHRVYWRYVNEALGGVGGRFTVQVEELDTAYDEELARALFAEESEQLLGVSAMLGSPITAAVLDEALDTEILIAAGSQASSWAVSPNAVLNLALPTYRDQVAGVISVGGVEGDPPLIGPDTGLGLLYQEGAFGEDCWLGYDEALAFSERDLLRIGHAPTVTDFGDTVAQVEESGVEALLVCTNSQALLSIVATFDLADTSPLLIASSQSYDPSLVAALAGSTGEEAGLEQLANVLLIGSLPQFEGDDPGMKLLRDNLDRYGTDVPDDLVDSWFFLGYVQAATYHLILEEAFDGNDLTRLGVWAARDRLPEIDLGFGSGTVAYDPDRVPIANDAISVPVASSVARFGMVPVSSYYPTRRE